MEIQENREPEPVSQITDKQHYKVFVGGLAPTTTSDIQNTNVDFSKDDLREYFSKFGLVDEVTVMRERVTGRSRCFAFMTFLDQEALEKVLELPQHWFRERTIEVKRAIPRGEVKARSRKLFVGGIPPSVTSEALRAAFEKYGKILDAQVMKDRVRDRPRGFGFITFEDDATLDQVLAESQHELGGKVVDVKKAEPKKVSVPHSNNPNPYPMVPALTYFIPYHVLPGPGGESFVSFPSTYPDIYYPHPTVSQPGIPQPQILPFDQRPSYGEIQAAEDAIENFNISGTHRQSSEPNIGFSPQGLPVPLSSSPNMYSGANKDAANQSFPSPTDGENNKSKKSNSNKKNENSNEEKNSGANDNCSKNSANSNNNNNNNNNNNSNSNNNNNAIVINDQNSSLINPNNKNGYNVGNVNNNNNNNNSPNNNSNNPIKNRRSPIFLPYNFVPSIISGLSQPYPPPPMYLPFPYDHSTPTSYSNPATSNPH